MMQELAAQRSAAGRDQPVAQPRPPARADRRARPVLGRAHPDHRRRPAGPARAAAGDDGGDGPAAGRRRLCRAPRARRRDRVQEGHRQALLPAARPSSPTIEIPLDTGDFRLMSRRALDALAEPARAGALHPRHGRLGRLQAGAVRSTTGPSASCRQHQISAAQDDRASRSTRSPASRPRRCASPAISACGWSLASVLLLVYIGYRLPHRQRGPGLDLD